jgi:DNA-binding FrmR family transcriptional regulator
VAKRKVRPNKPDVLARARRATGQARAVVEMIERDAYCIDVLNQIAAARGALLSLARVVLADHLRSCVSSALRGRESEQAIAEVGTVLWRYLK